MTANDNCIGSRSRARMSSPSFLPRAVNARASAQGRDRLRRFFMIAAWAVAYACVNYAVIQGAREVIIQAESQR